MRFKSIALIIGISLSAAAMSPAALAELRADDDNNRMVGTNGETMMWSTDSGNSWYVFETNTDGEDYGLFNNFPGYKTVIVATYDINIMQAENWDPTRSYSTAGTTVRHNGYYWTNQWWANPGEEPGVDSVWKKGDPANIEQLGVFQFTPWTGEKAEQYQQERKQAIASTHKVVGYFPEWGVYEAHNFFTPIKVNTSNISHLNYGFAVVKNGVVEMHDKEKAPELMPEISRRMHTSGVYTMISIGGWDNSLEGAFEAATATPEGVERLAQSMVDYMYQWGFSGIDVDWEYPDSEQEKAQFTSLIQTVRGKLDELGKQNDSYYQLSAAVTTNYKNIQYINPQFTTPLLDMVNVMAYDIHGAFDPITGHNAPLYPNAKDADQKLNASSAMSEYVNTWKVPKNKLLMGIPFYGRGWGDVAPTEIVKGLPGLFASGTASVKGTWDDVGQFTGTNPWYVLKDKLANDGYVRYWDNESRVPYMYNPTTKVFLTYDDPQSVREKVNYIKQQGFGGAVIWDLSGDTSDYELGNIVNEVRKGNVSPNITDFRGGRVLANTAAAGFKWTMSREFYENSKLRFTMPTPTDNSKYEVVIDKNNSYSNKCDSENQPGSETVTVCVTPGFVTELNVEARVIDNKDVNAVYASAKVTQETLNTAESRDVIQSYIKNVNGDVRYYVQLANDLYFSRQYLNMYIDHKDKNGKVTSSVLIGSMNFVKSLYRSKYSSVVTAGNHTYSSSGVRDVKAGDEYVFALADGSQPSSSRLKVLSKMTVTQDMLKK
ncbi:TPA: glycosyl hydrolase family 18 protein [Citrobacter braakii]